MQQIIYINYINKYIINKLYILIQILGLRLDGMY